MDVFFMVIFLLVAYFLPAVIAYSRGHQNFGAILALNTLMGWTGLFWVGAFVWSLTNNTKGA